MRLIFITFLSCSLRSSATAERDTPIDDFLVEILEVLREKLPAGIAETGIPPLDPFDLPDLEVPHIEWVIPGNHSVIEDSLLRDEVVSLDIDVKDIVVRNISTFVIKEAHVSLESLRLDLELEVSKLRVRLRVRLL